MMGGGKSVLTFQEKRLLDLFRAADEQAKNDAIWMLEWHQRNSEKTPEKGARIVSLEGIKSSLNQEE